MCVKSILEIVLVGKGDKIMTESKTAPDMRQMVEDFHHKFNFSIAIPFGDDPDILNKRMVILEEEMREFREAVAEGDQAHILKEMCDVLYATLGFAVCYGLPVHEGFARVHASNMSKSPTPIVDGKAIKGPDYFPADLADLFPAENTRKAG